MIPFGDFTFCVNIELHSQATLALRENVADLLVYKKYYGEPFRDYEASEVYPRLRTLTFKIDSEVIDLSKLVSHVQNCNSLESIYVRQFNHYGNLLIHPTRDATLAKSIK